MAKRVSGMSTETKSNTVVISRFFAHIYARDALPPNMRVEQRPKYARHLARKQERLARPIAKSPLAQRSVQARILVAPESGGASSLSVARP